MFYLKHDNTSISYVFMWNWTKYVIYNDVIFIASCIDHAIGCEIQWPSREKCFFWLAINLNYKVALRLLLGHLSKFGNLRPKKCIQWTIQPLLITKACSSILTLDIMGLSVMLISCDLQRFTRVGNNVSPQRYLFWIPIGWP